MEWTQFAGLHRSVEDYWIGNFERVGADCDYNFLIKPDALKKVKHCNLYGIRIKRRSL